MIGASKSEGSLQSGTIGDEAALEVTGTVEQLTVGVHGVEEGEPLT